MWGFRMVNADKWIRVGSKKRRERLTKNTLIGEEIIDRRHGSFLGLMMVHGIKG